MAFANLVKDPQLQSTLDLSARTGQGCVQLTELLESQNGRTAKGDAAVQQAKLAKIIRAQLSELRGAHRDVALGSRLTKQLTADAKAEVDKLHLLYANLAYEEQHLREEIINCESHR